MGCSAVGLTLALSSLLVVYLRKLSNRLHGPSSLTLPAFSPDNVDSETYKSIDMLESIPSRPASLGYAVIGGSGFLGTYIVRLLLLRGETNIRILDLNPPSESVGSNPAVTFIKTDITSFESVQHGLSVPFENNSEPPRVIFHTAAIIRFWERFSYCWKASYTVNVLGTANVIKAAQGLPSSILIYTSTADTVIPRPRFLRLGWDMDNRSAVSDFDAPLSLSNRSENCYSRTKLLAEQLVKRADGVNGLRTGIIRPGYTIIGPNDRLVTSTLTMPRVPVWDKEWSSTNICVWDAAAAHLLLEDSLIKDIANTRGEAFLVTGDGSPWRLRDTREAVKHFATRNVILDEVSPLMIYLLAHLVEAFLFVRYHVLLPFYRLFAARPRLVPSWLGQVVYLQPATLEYLNNVVIDDTRARKILGYRPQWSTVQCIRYAVQEVESGNTNSTHGLNVNHHIINES